MHNDTKETERKLVGNKNLKSKGIVKMYRMQ